MLSNGIFPEGKIIILSAKRIESKEKNQKFTEHPIYSMLHIIIVS